MRFILLLTSLLCVSVKAGEIADIFVDAEDSTDGTTLTSTILGNMTNGTSIGTWSVNAAVDAGRLTVGSNNKILVGGDFTVGGADYDGTGTRSIDIDYTGIAHYIELDFTVNPNNVSVGFWWTPGVDTSYVWFDEVIIQSTTGDYVVFQRYNRNQIQLHTNVSNVSGITDSVNTGTATYWVTMVARKGTVGSPSTVELNYYDSSMVLVDSMSLATYENAGSQWDFIRFGRTDAHTGGDSFETSFDSIAIDITDATFPLLPDAAAATGPYWVSTTGAASWAAAQSDTPLSGTACASIATMNTNAAAGDTVYIRAGTTAAGTGQINLSNDGASGNPIIIEAYQNETFTIDNRTNAQGPAIVLVDRDYITFRKINTNDCQESVDLDTCTNIRFEDCNFVNHKNTASGWPVAVTVDDNSQFNVFDGCSIGTCGYDNGGDDAGSCVNLGIAYSETDATRYNLFVNCTLFRGGHDVVSDYAGTNYFDYCFFYNDDWYGTGPYGGRCIISEDDGVNASYPEHGGTTIRNCLFQRVGDPPDQDGTSQISIRTQRNRINFCRFVDASNSGISIVNEGADDNRIANCVFVRNGVNSTNADPDQKAGIVYFDWLGVDPTGNAVKNCIFYANAADNGFDGVTDPQTYANNWVNADGNPFFVRWSTGDLAPSNENAHDFNLTTTSGPIDNGGYLTTVSTATGSGTSFVVADSYWFSDGDGVALGDTIQLDGSITPLTVTDVNYSTHTITFTPSTNWTLGDGVAFKYIGNAPDQGVYEWLGGATRTLSAARRGGAAE